MAKLNDAKVWLERVTGDIGRANSIIVKCRDKGLFTKGKRGGTAPDLVGSDYSALLMCALSTASPTYMASEVRKLLNLRFNAVTLINSKTGKELATHPLDVKPMYAPLLSAFGLHVGSKYPVGTPVPLSAELDAIISSDKFFVGTTHSLKLYEAIDTAAVRIYLSPQFAVDGFDKIELLFSEGIGDAEWLERAAYGISTDRLMSDVAANDVLKMARDSADV